MEDIKLIPVFIDKSTKYKDRQIVRFYSFVVTIEESSTQYPTGDPKCLPDINGSEFKQLSASVIWLDSVHRFILSTPIDGGEFDNEDKIEQTFEYLDRHGFTVDTLYQTFTNLPSRSHLNFQRGQVYRMRADLMPFSHPENSDEFILNNNNVLYSPEEGKAFESWHSTILSPIIMRYKMQSEQSLRKRFKRSEK